MNRVMVSLFAVLYLIILIAPAGHMRAEEKNQPVLVQESYLKPSQDIIDAVTAPRHLNVSLRNLGPDGSHFLISKRAGLPGLTIYAKPFINIGETEFDYLANRNRRLTTSRTSAFELFNYKTGKRILLKPPSGSWVSSATWSHDGTKLAYYVHNESATHIYVAQIPSGKAKRITRQPVLATLNSTFYWTPDNRGILTVLIPDVRKPQPKKPAVAHQPIVRMSKDGKTPTRTFRSVLEGFATTYEKDMLEWLGTGQLALIDTSNRKVKKIAKPDMYRATSMSICGNYVRVSIMQKPFSYIVPINSYGAVNQILDLQGKVVAELEKQPLREGQSGFGRNNQNGNRRRNVTWRPDGKGLSFLQREPSKKKEKKDADEEEESTEEEEERKDRVMFWPAPFEKDGAKVLYQSDNSINSVSYSQDCLTLFISETEKGEQHLFAMKVDNPEKKQTIYKFKGQGGRYSTNSPGNLMTKPGKSGARVVRVSSKGDTVYLSGTKYAKKSIEEAPRPFIHSVNITSGEKKTLFQSEKNVYENVLTVADDDCQIIFTERETPTTIEDSYIRDIKAGTLKKLTQNKNYSPEITSAVRKRLQVTRVDGIKFWVNVTLPPGYVKGSKLPAMFWFYPREFTSQKNYDRSTARYNKNAFPSVRTRSMEFLTKLGYAVVAPDWPIIGKSGQMNNNYVPDMQRNAWAVIDALDKLAYIDRDKLAIGGHSYGAFGTANVMIHTPYFKAGIAGDGNYNRTLTPMGFQSERRNLWEAREVYLAMSPLLWAERFNGALLMYHGLDDANTGTFPVHAPRMFQMLNGLGKDVALYMYPYEHHGPATLETTLDLWARWIKWLDKYIMHPEKYKKEKKEREKKEKK